MIEKKKVYMIINPASGTSAKEGLPNRVAKILDPYSYEVCIFITGYAGHGNEIARRAVSEGVDYVIAVGGDGTVNEVASAIVDTDVVLGIIPLGSGNGLARDLKISTNAKQALQTIADGNIISIDYGKANDNIFFCTCGVGFDAEVAAKVKGLKNRGTLMYFQKMLESYFAQEPQTYEIITPEGTIHDKAFVVTCANASQYGYNAHIAPQADIQDGKMDLAIIKPLSLTAVPKISLQLFTRKIDTNKHLVTFTTRKATIRREHPGVMHIDGDPIEAGTEINVEIINKGLKVIVPTDNLKD